MESTIIGPDDGMPVFMRMWPSDVVMRKAPSPGADEINRANDPDRLGGLLPLQRLLGERDEQIVVARQLLLGRKLGGQRLGQGELRHERNKRSGEQRGIGHVGASLSSRKKVVTTDEWSIARK